MGNNKTAARKPKSQLKTVIRKLALRKRIPIVGHKKSWEQQKQEMRDRGWI